ncbi:flavin-containing monooxygenase [Vannielia litorea]|uniref:flavin-containing monooxygenase n=1 Tax=Vannielia litorea TaxID=1217970 RepID=UPI001BCED91E|nr:NAD(P)/FAD-dependent oxidoreductase [Vannielia litorea]
MKAIVIGAGPAGLAAGACLKRAGVQVALLERAKEVAPAWHAHYDRLHLHTARGRSALPFRPMPKGGRYPSRAEVADYLESYARAEGLEVRTSCSVEEVRREGALWQVRHSAGEDSADVVVFATGLNGTPRLPDWPGLDGFPGQITHSSEYRNAKAFAGQRVLVAGIGNSGGDIALDLAEGGAEVVVSARGPVSILPKEIFGIPVTSMQLVQRTLGPRIADAVTGPVIRALIGRPSDYGFATPAYGPVTQVVRDGRVPLIDPGILGAIRAGRVAVRGAVARVEDRKVIFAEGQPERFDAIVAATGYTHDLRPMLPGLQGVLDAAGSPRINGAPTAAPGLYFISYKASPNGQLKQIGIEAKSIARAVTND